MGKLLFLFQIFLLQNIALTAQVGIGTDHPDPSAVLDLKGNGKQGLLMPQVDDYHSINNPKPGLIVYDKHIKAMLLYNGKDWIKILNTINLSNFECNTFDEHAFDHVLKNKELAYKLAKKFAPILKFDKMVSKFYYPTSLENILKYSKLESILCGGRLSTISTDHFGNRDFLTYYGIKQSPYNKDRTRCAFRLS